MEITKAGQKRIDEADLYLLQKLKEMRERKMELTTVLVYLAIVLCSDEDGSAIATDKEIADFINKNRNLLIQVLTKYIALLQNKIKSL